MWWTRSKTACCCVVSEIHREIHISLPDVQRLRELYALAEDEGGSFLADCLVLLLACFDFCLHSQSVSQLVCRLALVCSSSLTANHPMCARNNLQPRRTNSLCASFENAYRVGASHWARIDALRGSRASHEQSSSSRSALAVSEARCHCSRSLASKARSAVDHW